LLIETQQILLKPLFCLLLVFILKSLLWTLLNLFLL